MVVIACKIRRSKDLLIYCVFPCCDFEAFADRFRWPSRRPQDGGLSHGGDSLDRKRCRKYRPDLPFTGGKLRCGLKFAAEEGYFDFISKLLRNFTA